MADEPNTPEDTGIDNVGLSENDTSTEFDYYDPDEDQDTVESEGAVETDDEAVEADGQETDDQPEVEEPVATEATLEAIVTMADGTKMSVDDLVKGNLRQADYTRKAQELSTERKAFDVEV
jgi:hypothetical protein